MLAAIDFDLEFNVCSPGTLKNAVEEKFGAIVFGHFFLFVSCHMLTCLYVLRGR